MISQAMSEVTVVHLDFKVYLIAHVPIPKHYQV